MVKKVILKSMLADNTLNANDKIIYSTLVMKAAFCNAGYNNTFFGDDGKWYIQDDVNDYFSIEKSTIYYLSKTIGISKRTIERSIETLMTSGLSKKIDGEIYVFMNSDEINKGYIEIKHYDALTADQSIIYSYLCDLSKRYKVINTWSSKMCKVFSLSQPQLLKQIRNIAKAGLIDRTESNGIIVK